MAIDLPDCTRSLARAAGAGRGVVIPSEPDGLARPDANAGQFDLLCEFAG